MSAGGGGATPRSCGSWPWRRSWRRVSRTWSVATRLTVTGLVGGGLFTAVDAAGRRGAVGDTRRAIEQAHEPQHPLACADRSVLCTLAQALDLCDELGAGVGGVLDVYHVCWDLARQVARAQGRIALFQASDWLAPPTGACRARA